MQHHAESGSPLDAVKLIDALERFGGLFPSLMNNISIDDARWKPRPEDWSILEVVRHLGDEEVDDFRARLRSTLENPATAWPQIRPEVWAVERKYNEADFGEAVDRFVGERAASVRWLRSLKQTNWSQAYVHPKVGPVPAGDLLASWAAHDALHLRQIAKRMHQLAGHHAGAFNTRYAGEW